MFVMTSRPLLGKTIILTGLKYEAVDSGYGNDAGTGATGTLAGRKDFTEIPSSLSLSLNEILLSRGAKVISFPTICVQEEALAVDVFFAAHHPDEFDWIFFTSKNAVEFFFRGLSRKGISQADLQCKFAVVGGKTAEVLIASGAKAGFVPQAQNARGLATEFLHFWNSSAAGAGWDKSCFLYVLGKLAPDTLSSHLDGIAAGTRLDVYDTVIPETVDEQVKKEIQAGNYDLLLFTSPSTFYNFLMITRLDAPVSGLRAACIGKTTERAMREGGYEPLLVASSPQPLVFAGEIEEYYRLVT